MIYTPAEALGPRRDTVHGSVVERTTSGRVELFEPARTTQVTGEWDVIVVGGGPAGVVAALAAGRSGARTLLVERHGMLGGVWTAGLLNPLFDSAKKGWLVEEIVNELCACGAWRKWAHAGTFDTEAMKLLLERLCDDAGVEVWYHTLFVDPVVGGRRCAGVIVENKTGRRAALAKVVIDCSGDGDVFARAGCGYHVGRAGDGACQPMTLMFEIDGIGTFDQKNSEQLYDLLTDAITKHQLGVSLPFKRVNYAPWIIRLPREGAAVVQATHVYNVSATDAAGVSRATIDARIQADDLVNAIRHVPGLERVRLVQTAPAIGVREGRRLAGRYTLSLDDLRAGSRFEDAVTFGAFHIDIHDLDADGRRSTAHCTPVQPYEIPYRCLLPVEVDGLIVAGRCLSGTHEAHASYRVTGICAGTGQAAGLAAGMAVRARVLPHEIGGAELRRQLEARGAGFLEPVMLVATI